jgi:hypothetical protein
MTEAMKPPTQIMKVEPTASRRMSASVSCSGASSITSSKPVIDRS